MEDAVAIVLVESRVQMEPLNMYFRDGKESDASGDASQRGLGIGRSEGGHLQIGRRFTFDGEFQSIRLAEANHVGDVVFKRRKPAYVMSDLLFVQGDVGVAVDSVESQLDPSAGPVLGHREPMAIPGCRVFGNLESLREPMSWHLTQTAHGRGECVFESREQRGLLDIG